MKNIFNDTDCKEFVARINRLTPATNGLWGKMSVDQMLAHCNVSYEMAYENIHPKPNFLMKFILKSFVKNRVVNEAPYPKNNPTAPAFKIVGDKNFELEKNRLISYILKTKDLGTSHFEGLESHSFGKLSSTEWNNMFAKHLDHHLSQFGV